MTEKRNIGVHSRQTNRQANVEGRNITSSRREFLTDVRSSVIALAALGLTSPVSLAAAKGKPPKKLKIFSQSQAATYAAWADILAIGAAKAGVAQFVDKYLAGSYPDSLLLLRYLQNPPFDEFYIKGIAGIDQESQARYAQPFLSLPSAQQEAIVKAAATSTTIAWIEPTPNFFYFVSRSDAVDVVYGTVKGFHQLDIPYLPHIRPRIPW